MGITGLVQQSGMLWSASEEGVQGIDLETQQATAHTALDVRCFLATAAQVWCGTGNGVYFLSGKQWIAPKIEGNGPGSSVRALAIDSEGSIWCAANLGLGKLADSAQTSLCWQETYDTPDGLPSRRISCLCVDAQGTLWCGTAKGLARFQAQTDTFVVDSAINSQVVALVGDERGTVYMATQAELSKRDGESWSTLSGWRQFLNASATPQCLLIDRLGRLWCGTSAGLVVRAEGVWQSVNMDGTLSAQSLATDPQGNIWCGTEQGVFGIKDFRAIPLQTYLGQVAVSRPVPYEEGFAEEILPSMPIEPILFEQSTLNVPISPALLNPELPTQPIASKLLSDPEAAVPTQPKNLPTAQEKFIRLSVMPTQATIPIGSKEIFQIHVDRQNTEEGITFAGLAESRGISVTIIQKSPTADSANLLVSVGPEAVPGDFTLTIQAEAPGIAIYRCSVEIKVVEVRQALAVSTPNAVEQTPVVSSPTKPKKNLIPLFVVLSLFLGGGALIWQLGRSAVKSSLPTPTPIASVVSPTPTVLVPQPEKSSISTTVADPQPSMQSKTFTEDEAQSLVNDWQKVKQEIYADPQNADGETGLRSVLTDIMLKGTSGHGGRLNSWEQLKKEGQRWRYNQKSLTLQPRSLSRVNDTTAYATFVITESGEKLDASGNLVHDNSSPYNSTYAVRYRFAYDEELQGWRLAECWGATRTLPSCNLDRQS